MELKELIHPLEVLEVVGNTDVEISGIQSDSRKVEKAFVCGGSGYDRRWP